MDETRTLHHLNLGQRFREMRERAGYTRGRIGEAADAIGISRAALDQFERGTASPKLETLHRMAQVYMCEMGDMLPRTETGYGREFEPLAAALMGLPAEAREAIIRNFASTIKYTVNSALATQRDVAPVGQMPTSSVTRNTNATIPDTVPSDGTAALLGHPQIDDGTAEGTDNGSRRNGIEENQPRGGRKPKR